MRPWSDDRHHRICAPLNQVVFLGYEPQRDMQHGTTKWGRKDWGQIIFEHCITACADPPKIASCDGVLSRPLIILPWGRSLRLIHPLPPSLLTSSVCLDGGAHRPPGAGNPGGCGSTARLGAGSHITIPRDLSVPISPSVGDLGGSYLAVGCLQRNKGLIISVT